MLRAPFLVAALLALSSGFCFREHPHYFIPVFSERVSGASGSVWSSELDLENPGLFPLEAQIRVFPQEGVVCSTTSVVLKPNEHRRIFSLGCVDRGGQGMAPRAAVEIFSASPLRTAARIIRTDANGGRLVMQVPVVEPSSAFSHRSCVATPAGSRHTLGLVNPNPFPIEVALVAGPDCNRALLVPARSTLQVGHALTDPACTSISRLETASEGGFYLYDSVTDPIRNETAFVTGRECRQPLAAWFE